MGSVPAWQTPGRASRSAIVLLSVLVVVQCAGCTRWRVVDQIHPEMLDGHHGTTIRATLRNSSVVVLKEPVISQGRVIGLREADTIRDPETRTTRYLRETRVEVPLSEITRLEAKEVDETRTAVLILGAGAVVVGTVLAYQALESSLGGDSGPLVGF